MKTTNTLGFILIASLVLLTTLSGNSAVYTTVSNGNWQAANIWSPSKPQLKWGFSDTLIINHQINLNASAALYGHIIVSQGASITNSAKSLTLHSGGTLINNGTIYVSSLVASDDGNTNIVNNGSIKTEYNLKNEDGTFVNNGSIIVKTSFSNAWNGSFINNQNASLTVQSFILSQYSFVNHGTVDVTANFTNVEFMTLQNTGSINVGGVLNNKGPFQNQGVVAATGNFIVNYCGSLDNSGTITSLEMIKNYTSLINSGTVTSSDDMFNYGYISNTNTINVLGNFKNDWSHTVDNYGVINVLLDLTNFGDIINDGALIVDGAANTTNGTIDGDGDLCHSDGVTDPTGGAKGVSCKICSGESATLPVTLVDFSANYIDGIVRLSWITNAEVNNKEFQIEYSIDGSSFETVGTVEGQGNSNVVVSYSFNHQNPSAGVVYYRLRQIDFDGQSTVSEIIVIQVNQQNEVELYPNPANQGESITLNRNSSNSAQVDICSSNGQIINSFKTTESVIKINTESLKTGLYIIRIFQDNAIIYQKLQVN